MASSSAKFMCFFIIIGLVVPSLATDYYVPWSVGVDLNLWLSGKSFCVGDVLHFEASVLGLLTAVIVVDYNAFLQCTGQGTLLVAIGGDCSYQLTQPGPVYFTANANDCSGGLKLGITVGQL